MIIELSEILGVTTQSISNFRKEGMPYFTADNVGYFYSFTAIKWFCMFKGQSLHDNRTYKNTRKLIERYNEHINNSIDLLNNYNSTLTEKQKSDLIDTIIKNKESVSQLYTRL